MEGRTCETGQSVRGERLRFSVSAAGGHTAEAHGGFAGVAGSEAGDEIGGEREPPVEET